VLFVCVAASTGFVHSMDKGYKSNTWADRRLSLYHRLLLLCLLACSSERWY